MPAKPSQPASDFYIVAIGASAGGLEACIKLVKALPARPGMAFILVQHLDPNHDSLMAELLSAHTSMQVRQAAEGVVVEPDHIYVIPPGAYLAVVDGALRLSEPQARHGARLPFDFLLQSLADGCGWRAIGVVLSGAGADGSRGLKSVKEKGGLIIAQDPNEAGHDGMPRNAMLTGAVDLVLPVARIPDALIAFEGRTARRPLVEAEPLQDGEKDWLPQILKLVRSASGHDFSLYKEGTLRRRIERRRALAAIDVDQTSRYVETLRRDPRELDLLVKDLLINTTSFFRDVETFDLLAATTLPEIVRRHPADRPIRIWVAGCSTGEEAYSFAIMFREVMTAEKRNLKLQIFASDVDADALLVAREGFYPMSIETDVSPERLDRHFFKEDNGYRANPELRAAVVFTAHDMLSDPPFSRLDLMACRNVMIYFGSEAQTKMVSLFHFALRDGGVLVLGGAETAGNIEGRFEVVSKTMRVYQRIGRSRPGEFGLPIPDADNGGARLPTSSRLRPEAPTRELALGDLCRRLIMEAYAPAAVLIDDRHERLYGLGAVDRYLRVAPGYPNQDLLSMAPHKLRARLRSAIDQARQADAPVVSPGGEIERDGRKIPFKIAVHPVRSGGDRLLLVCFVDEPERQAADGPAARSDRDAAEDGARFADLEQELEATRLDLQAAIRDLETSTEEQNTINEEARSVSEEFQSTNEELLTSKEELQSLNEELTALNSQLQETLDRQRVTSTDLQNVLYSTDVATLFLDRDLNIRFFTPATQALFRVIAGDVGRPLADLASIAADPGILPDSRTVLENLTPIEREIEANTGLWYLRRILPYRAQDDRIEGVVVIFADVTERKRAADALEAAKRQAENANVAKTRFLAAASHDLRQPLQTMALIPGLLATHVQGEKGQSLVARLEETVEGMASMLNALLDINQIEAGAVKPEITNFAIGELLHRIGGEFVHQAEAKDIELRTVACGLSIDSDRRLLEQMIRNLLSNALKYTRSGKVLLGCRRSQGVLGVEVWDTGIGIPDAELVSIFNEYHQVDNPARERGRGLGLGLSIVKSLGDLLDHRVSVRSRPGRGSAFRIDVKRRSADPPKRRDRRRRAPAAVGDRLAGAILMIEDDPEVRDLLRMLIEHEGHRVTVATDGAQALKLAAQAAAPPDLILADYNLPNGPNGLQTAATLREQYDVMIPVIILTGDISIETLSAIARQDCAHLRKPVKPKELTLLVQRLLAGAPDAEAPSAPMTTRDAKPAVSGSAIVIIDDDRAVGDAMRAVIEEAGLKAEAYETAEAFLRSGAQGRAACLLIDAHLPGMSGLDLLRRLRDDGTLTPAIMITGSSDVPMAVAAMKTGASDFIEKPVGRGDLLASVERVRAQARGPDQRPAWQESAARQLTGLTARQREIMDMILAGNPNKNIAADLGISQRTVENHRATIMQKTGSKSLPALARLALAAAWRADENPVG